MYLARLSFSKHMHSGESLEQKNNSFLDGNGFIDGDFYVSHYQIWHCARLYRVRQKTRRFYGSCVMRKFVREHSHGERPDSLNRELGDFLASAKRASKCLPPNNFRKQVFPALIVQPCLHVPPPEQPINRCLPVDKQRYA